MEAPQIIMIALVAASVGLALAKNGESKGEFNVVDWFVAPAIYIGILYWGGFFA